MQIFTSKHDYEYTLFYSHRLPVARS